MEEMGFLYYYNKYWIILEREKERETESPSI